MEKLYRRYWDTSGSGADYDVGIIIRNCLFWSGGVQPFHLASSGGLTFKPGGAQFYNCTVWSGGTTYITTNATSTSIPCLVYNNILYRCGLSASVSGQITENYNFINSGTTHSNVTPGGNTITTRYAPNFHVGQERLVGANPRMFFEPTAGSWALTFGNDGTYTTSEDFLGLPRPGGGGSATKGWL